MNNKLPLWKDRVVIETAQSITDEEIKTRILQHHENCNSLCKKIESWVNENK